jgi:hypothetical protein
MLIGSSTREADLLFACWRVLMPWKASSAMEERLCFVVGLRGLELARRFPK